MYLTITSQDTTDALAINVVHREREFHQYQINIDNYTAMLAALPQGDIPSDIAPYMDTPTEDLPAFIPLETIQLISDYQWRKRISVLIRTEAIEQNKVKRILDALKAQLPADQLDTLVAAALVKVNAQSAPSA
jgi:hypothetical protein